MSMNLALASGAQFDDGPLVGAGLAILCHGAPSLLNAFDQPSSGEYLPVRRNLAQPLNAGVLDRDIRVEALCDGTGDEGGALLLEELDQPLLLGHQRIDPRRL